MSRLFRILLLFVAGLFGLVLVLAIVLPLLIDPNDYRDEISAFVEDRTGRSLEIQGDLELSVFPWIGVETGGVRLGNAEGFADTPFLSLDAVDARLRLWPLLRGDLEVGTLILSGVQVNLERAADGSTNWEDLAGGSAPADDSPREAGAFELGGIQISDSNLRFVDHAAETEIRVSGLRLSTGSIAPGRSTSLETAFALAMDPRGMRADVVLSAGVMASEDMSRFSVSDLVLDLDVQDQALPVDPMSVSMKLQTAEFDQSSQQLRVNGFEATSLGVSLAANFNGAQVLDSPAITGDLVVSEFSPRDLMSQLAPDYTPADPDAMKVAALEAAFSADPTSVNLSDLSMVLDDTELKGSFGIADLETAALRFDLAVDSLDLDRYLPEADEEADEDEASLDHIELPLETIRGLNLQGKLSVGRLVAGGIISTEVSMEVNAADGDLRVAPSRAKLYQGSYQGDIRVQARSQDARVTIDERIEGVQLGGAVQDLFEVEKVTGRLDATARLTATGRTVGDLKETLDGNMDFALREGAVQGVDLWGRIRQAYAVYKGEPRPDIRQPEQTRFTDIIATASVADGVVSNQDLAARLPFLRVAGSGTVDLVRETVDYRLATTVVKVPELEGDATAEALYDLAIPVKISGPFDDLSVRPDVAGILEAKARQKLEEKKDEVEEDLKDKLKDKLKGLFGDG